MTEKQLLALVTAILLRGQQLSDEAVRQAIAFARVILKETQ